MPEYKFEEGFAELLDKFPSLKSAQFDACRETAIGRVVSRLGDRPERSTYHEAISAPDPKEEDFLKLSKVGWVKAIRKLADPTDAILPVILFILLLISLMHMLTFAGGIAESSYQASPTPDFRGIWLGRSAWTWLHQIGFFGFSELGVLFFYSRSAIAWRRSLSDESKKNYRRWLNGNMILAFLCAAITVTANIVSLSHGAITETMLSDGGFIRTINYPELVVDVVIGTLVPAITMFLGERISELVLSVLLVREQEQYKFRRAQVTYERAVAQADADYAEALSHWHSIHQDPTTFDLGDGVNSYQVYLAAAIVDYYKRHIRIGERGSKALYDDWTPELQLMLGAREIARMRQMTDLGAAIDGFFTSSLLPKG
jgi:hypothetical protein